MLTPTGYIGESDIDTLEAVLRAAPGLNAEAVISLPLDITWATSEWVEVLIDLAAATPAPKAIMLTGLPREGVPAKEILFNLRLVASQVPQSAFCARPDGPRRARRVDRNQQRHAKIDPARPAAAARRESR